MDWDADFAEDHLLDLADEHEVQIMWDDNPQHAYTTYRVVHISHPTDPVKYLIALHEFGHICSPRARLFERKFYKDPREYDDYLLCESSAWAWAARFCHEGLYEEINGLSWKRVGALWATALPYTREVKISRKTAVS